MKAILIIANKVLAKFVLLKQYMLWYSIMPNHANSNATVNKIDIISNEIFIKYKKWLYK